MATNPEGEAPTAAHAVSCRVFAKNTGLVFDSAELEKTETKPKSFPK